jgi:hypothetical protein
VCASDGDCCSDYCDVVAGACAPACAYEHGDCITDADCCGVLVCGADGTCGSGSSDDAGAPTCSPPGTDCLDNSECCSDECDYYSLTCF